MSGRDLGCQALSSWVTLGGSRGSTNQARTMPCEREDSILSALCIRVRGCAHLQITLGSLQFPSLSQLGRRGDLTVKKIVSCFALKVIATVRFICIFNYFQNSFLLPKSHDTEKYLKWEVL